MSAAAPLSPAPPTRPGDVVDAHVHLFAMRIMEEWVEAAGREDPEDAARFDEALKDRRFGRRGSELLDLGPEEMAVHYAGKLRAAGVTKALAVSVVPGSRYAREFVRAANGHVHMLCNLDPRARDACSTLESEMAAGFRGVKLLPVNRRYRLSDPACRPFFEKAAELGAPMIVHYGVTVDPRGDLRYADPLDLSPVARDFPEVTFVIAHFGAGWFGEVLKLAYQCRNVCVDTSGTNNWLDNYPVRMTLADVFERALTALGPERVLFGTDSSPLRPYREWIKYQQTRTLEEIGLSEADRDLVLRGNAVRIFGLDG